MSAAHSPGATYQRLAVGTDVLIGANEWLHRCCVSPFRHERSDTAGEVQLALAGALQREARARGGLPGLQRYRSRNGDGSLEHHVDTRWRFERARIERGETARHRPHAVRNGLVEAEQARAEVAEVDRIEVA